MVNYFAVARMVATGAMLVSAQHVCWGQAASEAKYKKLCTISFQQDTRRPARVEEEALPCLLQAKQAVTGTPGTRLYLVATADRFKDNEAGHGTERTEQDMSGEDIRYADVAAYRAVNSKAYLVRWLKVDPKKVVPLTSYEDGQWLEVYLAPDDLNFKAAYPKPTAPILARPCTVPPCAHGDEEFLVAQPRSEIVEKSR